VVTITWDDVGYFNSQTNLLNAFQLQLIDRGDGNFDIVFRYEDINWTTGSASGGSGGLGGTPARAGYTAGDGNPAHYFELAGSGTQNPMLALEDTVGNTGIAGVHVFEVRAGDVGSPTSAGTIEFSDPDAGDAHSVSSSFNVAASDAGPALGTLNATLTRDTATGVNGIVTWNYVADPEAIANLPPGTTRTEVYDVVIDDGHGGTVTQQVTITINGPETAGNNRPALDEDASPALAAVNEDAGAPVGAVGTLVSALVDLDSTQGGLDNVADSDAGAVTGIAIYGANQTHGTLFYSTDNGATWSQVGNVSDSAALLLAADANTRLYFQPNAGFDGTINDVITFRAWDQTEGTNGQTFDIGLGGANTDSVSGAPDSVSVTVNETNEPPLISVENAGTTEEGSATTLFGLTVTDTNAAAEEVFHVTAVAQHGTLSMADGDVNAFDEDASPSGMEFHATLDEINAALQQGIVYHDPTEQPGLVDTVTLTVTDAIGGTDTINFIFNVFGNSSTPLTGTAGKDVLFTTGFNDVLTGGDAEDIFVFTPEDGSQHDTITDFVQGEDRIALYDFYHDFDEMVASGAFTHLGGNQIDLGNGNSITLQNFTAPLTSLTAQDFIFHA
jgi:VCBS repeat-containing protein